MRLSHKLVLASLNRDKFDEFKSLLSAYPDLELVRPESLLRNPGGLKFAETHDTYLENATAKARLCNQGSHYPSLGDDSGLEVMALEGRPGVKSHRYATPVAGMSQDEANTRKLLQELQGKNQREARFVCHLALVIEGIMIHASGTLDGTILESARGTHGFGYDPVFVPKGSGKTLAEMNAGEKNSISHRARALQELMSKIQAHGIVFAKP